MISTSMPIASASTCPGRRLYRRVSDGVPDHYRLLADPTALAQERRLLWKGSKGLTASISRSQLAVDKAPK